MSNMTRTIDGMRKQGVVSPYFKNNSKGFDPIPPVDLDPSKESLIDLNPKTGKYTANSVRIAEYLRDLGYRCLDDTCYQFDGRYLKPISEKTIKDVIINCTRTVDDPPMISDKAKRDVFSYWESISTPAQIDRETPSEILKSDYSGWLIPFENGIYKVDEDRLVPFNPDVLFTSYIHADYIPNIVDEDLEAVYLNIFGDEEVLKFFYLAAGYTLYSEELNPAAIFILQGGGETGKSAILNTLESLIGSDKVANLSPDKLSEQFGPYRLKGMVANLCDEAGNKGSRFTRINGDMLKAISAGRPWDIERKYKDVEQYTNEAKLWFAANSTPNLGDNSSGMMRRVFIFPCNIKQDPSARIYDTMASPRGRAWLAFKALDAFLRFKLSGVGEFVEPPRMAEMKEVLHSMDSISDYILEEIGPLSDRDAIRGYFDRKSTVEAYSEYRNQAILSGWDSPLKKGTFISHIITEFDMGVKTFARMDGITRTSYRGFYKK